jgi:hypothetical protein
MSSAAPAPSHMLPARVSVGGPERSFMTIARDAEGTWSAADGSLANDGPSHMIRLNRSWEPIASAAISAAVRFASKAYASASFIDCKGHIGWFGAIAAESGAAEVFVVESNRVYSDVAISNVQAASAAARVDVVSTLEEAHGACAASPACVMRLHGVHYDPFLSSFLRLAASRNIVVSVADFYAWDLKTPELLDFIVACTSIFYIVSLGPVESAAVPADESFFQIIHEHNARDKIKESETTGFSLLMIRKDEFAHGFIEHISMDINALIKKTHREDRATHRA